MSKECARSLKKGCGDRAAGQVARIDDAIYGPDSRSERVFNAMELVAASGPDELAA
jgi:hypothetical protein